MAVELIPRAVVAPLERTGASEPASGCMRSGKGKLCSKIWAQQRRQADGNRETFGQTMPRLLRSLVGSRPGA